MSADPLERIMDQVRELPVADQIEVARAIDRLTWRERWQAIQDDVSRRVERDPITDDEIDEIVRDVRREKPLHLRQSASPSAPGN